MDHTELADLDARDAAQRNYRDPLTDPDRYAPLGVQVLELGGPGQ
jgi:hypothetical protein